jgi:hypothetical protein
MAIQPRRVTKREWDAALKRSAIPKKPVIRNKKDLKRLGKITAKLLKEWRKQNPPEQSYRPRQERVVCYKRKSS